MREFPLRIPASKLRANKSAKITQHEFASLGAQPVPQIFRVSLQRSENP
jgi:hypothetical protein